MFASFVLLPPECANSRNAALKAYNWKCHPTKSSQIPWPSFLHHAKLPSPISQSKPSAAKDERTATSSDVTFGVCNGPILLPSEPSLPQPFDKRETTETRSNCDFKLSLIPLTHRQRALSSGLVSSFPHTLLVILPPCTWSILLRNLTCT